MREKRCVYRALGGEVVIPERKKPLGRARCRWKKILKCIFKRWNREAWTSSLTEDKERWWVLVKAVMNLRVP
jgi:hypothetical protein